MVMNTCEYVELKNRPDGLATEARTWCSEHIEGAAGEYWCVSFSSGCVIFEFARPADATMFALRWV